MIEFVSSCERMSYNAYESIQLRLIVELLDRFEGVQGHVRRDVMV